jgi:hypothetical protein
MAEIGIAGRLHRLSILLNPPTFVVLIRKASNPMEFLSDAREDVYKPSIFELIAQEQLRDLLQPAVKYVLAVSSIIETIKFV